VLVQQAQASGGKTLFEYDAAAGKEPALAYEKLVGTVYNER
jgi:hypothetical protein